MSTTAYYFCEEKRKYQYFWLKKKAPYLDLCSRVFNIKTVPLIRPLLGSIKGGLNSRSLLYI